MFTEITVSKGQCVYVLLFSEVKPRMSETHFPSKYKYLCKTGIKLRKILPLQNSWKSTLEWEIINMLKKPTHFTMYKADVQVITK